MIKFIDTGLGNQIIKLTHDHRIIVSSTSYDTIIKFLTKIIDLKMHLLRFLIN